ncbi:MAG: NADH-quinone oxidoreductase subunit L [Ignavibacteria bacterium]|nr:NADH-quinone oxidoreductase subunit L [Ignavibacteria bacterium]
MEFALNTLPVIILLIPLVSFLILIFFKWKLPRNGDWLGTSLLFVNLFLSFYVLYAFLSKGEYKVTFEWFSLGAGDSVFTAGFTIDALSALMLVVVNLISAVVHLFSVKYMEGDAKYGTYFAYLGLFTFSMLGIVVTNNLLIMYVFWELVGLSSYLLIGFWYENKPPQEAAKKAFIVNRIGDVGFLTGIMIVFLFIGQFGFSEIFEGVQVGKLSGGWLTAAGILIFCGAVGKSAQFPLHVWLPDAMEGPTPVSALIHAATMVAAGVYLVARVFIMFTADALTVITYIGAITAFISATIALTQDDIKKILAYSTISQLGYMIMALGIGAYSYGVFHLVTHAFFKACLFLGAGSVIIAMHHVQNISELGGLRKKMPLTFITFLVSTVSISGIPLTSGFLSKDSILAATIAFGNVNGGINYIIPVIAFLVAGLTAFYMFRIVIKTFFGEPGNKEKFAQCKESPLAMTLPLIILAVLSIFIFYSFNPIDAGSGWFLNTVQNPESLNVGTVGAIYNIIPQTEFQELIHHAHYPAMAMSIVIALLGILIAFVFYYWKKVDTEKWKVKLKPIYLFSLNKWYFDELYHYTAVSFTMLLSKLSDMFDKYIVDGLVNGSATFIKKTADFSGLFDKYIVDGLVNLSAGTVGFFGAIFRKTQTGKVQTYLAFLLFGIIVLYLIIRFI